MHKLHIQDITKTIKKTQILHGISIEVKSGEIVGLLGPNGVEAFLKSGDFFL